MAAAYRCRKRADSGAVTRAGESLYGNWREPPRKPRPFLFWLAVAVVSGMLVVNVVRGIATGVWNW